MEELLEMITWSQLGIHEKTVTLGFTLENTSYVNFLHSAEDTFFTGRFAEC